MENKSQKPVNKQKKKKFTISTKNMGINIDKNEYYEIILSNSNHPENLYK
ncbi:MAG: hypothetical protein MJ230_03440 [bacterium]|nr:hypothetical protein [bacterium]